MRKLITLLMLLFTAGIFAQGTITGTVIDSEMNSPLPGANVMVVGSNLGTTTDFDGNFSIDAKAATGTLRITFVGYERKDVKFDVSEGELDLGNIMISPDANALSEVVITSVADFAIQRRTPVAVSTIRGAEIREKLGNQEFPEILRSTPSIYVTKQGGGFGDSRINVRGFDQRNTAVLINGMPVNDMENGWVYWSNWAGLSDVTSAMQVQRGLGASKLAISSVGGTINVLTRAADREEGGSVQGTIGNDGYIKGLVSYNTGLMENGLSVSALFSRTEGDGYVDGTEFEAYNYYLAFGYKPNESHDFQLTITGAPQQHNQRGFAPSLSNYIDYGNGTDPNIKYNSDYGYRNGDEFTFSGNFYHKPVASLNWDWEISGNSKLSSVFYASLGRGGSVGSIGRINGDQSYSGTFKDENGLIRADDIVAWNSGQNVPDFGDPRTGYTGGGSGQYQGQYVNGGVYPSPYLDDGDHIYSSENGISQRSSVNSHNWFGAVINFQNEISEYLTLDAGVDLRTYKGIHYRRLVDLLGADVYVDNDNINNPYNFTTETYSPSVGNAWNVFKSVDDETKIDYYNDGKVNWAGAFGQLEYNNDVISAFVQGSISNQSFKRIDYFNYLDSDPEQESDWENLVGGNIKGGLNWNINENHNVFGNVGYYSKQPLFDAVFPSYTTNEVNDDLTNEKIFGIELGYGFKTTGFTADLNLYRTSWKDRFLSETVLVGQDQEGVANFQGIEQVHTGLELELSYKPISLLDFQGMLSVGNWEYNGNVNAEVFDSGQNSLGETILYLDGVKVGDAAQFTSFIEAGINPLQDLRFDVSWFHANNLYADFTGDSGDFVEQFGQENNQGALKLPSYDLFDAGASYELALNRESTQSLVLRVNVNNVFDETYISESDTNIFAEDGDATYKGISTSNRVYFGWGRTWNASVTYRF